ncbi:hypothetical protein Leryth_021524, partial [Lithospermum erythrorhizon]
KPFQRSTSLNPFCSFHNVHHVFDKSPKPPLISMHHSMLDYLHDNNKFAALAIFKHHLQKGISEIDEVSIAIALKACRGDLKRGAQIHGFSITTGFLSYLTVSNSLMNVYSKCGEFGMAMRIFEKLEYRDSVSYNTLLSGFMNGKEALCFASKMHSDGVVFDAVSYTSVLAHCADCEKFNLGTLLHCNVLKSGLDRELFIGNALVTLYSKSGRMVEAKRVFCGISNKDLVSWNALISGYAQTGSHGLETIMGFNEMMSEGMSLDHVSFTSAISACGHERFVEMGRQIHTMAFKSGYIRHVSVCNVLVSMYSKCEKVEDAKLVFMKMIDKNVISWTTMISIDEDNAVQLFNEMRRDGVYPNDVTFVGLIHAITINNLELQGVMVHAFCLKAGFVSELNVANSFVTMYAKFVSMKEADKIFEELHYRDVISWNALISGYAQNGMCQEAFETYLTAIMESWPNEYTFGSVLHAIASSESISLKHGQRCHSYLLKLGLTSDPIVSSALLDMYAKRGSIGESLKVFTEIGEKSEVAWTAIISAYARHGDYESVMSLFEGMAKKGATPDSVTFLSVLTACARKGMVNRGIDLFNSMVEDYSIKPSPEHFSCMVDMLGRAGRLKEADEFLNQIPGGPGLTMLQSLLGACRTYGNVDIAMRVADVLLEMEPEESGSYILMSNLYAEKGQWDKVAKVRKKMRDKGVKKEVGFSWVDVGRSADYLHAFSSGDKSHSQYEDIYTMAEWLGSETRYLEKQGGKGNTIRISLDEIRLFDSL